MTKFKAGDIIQVTVAPRPPAQSQIFLICRVINELAIKYAQYELYCYSTGKKARISCESIDMRCKLIKKASKMDFILYN